MKEYYLVDKSQIEALGVRNQKQFEKLTCGVVKGTIARKRVIGFNGEEYGVWICSCGVIRTGQWVRNYTLYLHQYVEDGVCRKKAGECKRKI